jgi:hypothetical protein
MAQPPPPPPRHPIGLVQLLPSLIVNLREKGKGATYLSTVCVLAGEGVEGAT